MRMTQMICTAGHNLAKLAVARSAIDLDAETLHLCYRAEGNHP